MSPISEPIAIIGSGCRFPGESSTPSKLWALLANPRDVLTKIPNIRFEPEGFYNDNGEYHGSTNVKESYLLSEDHRLFDAQFFKIKPIEAHSMDPQQRLLMETVYDSLESAGLIIQKMQGSDTAVYVGLMCEEYSAIVACDVDQLPTYTATATGRSIMSNRVSYFFDWHGPCMTIDTACSSSLVAVHQAIETLRNGSSKVAIAAGSNLLLGPTGYITESKLHMLSPGSRSRMWDADADGYARGDGIASLVLKKLSDAIKDGDHIDCIIRETGVNQDGRTTGITMPSSTAQETLIRATYAKAGLDVTKAEERCQFFEAHGTGTPAGDPIEASAIHNAFFGPDNREIKSGDTLYVGSIKTVIGHTEGTAGIAAVMKASLAIQNAKIPPNLHFRNLSPTVEPYYKNLKIATSALPWPTMPDGVPRRASVNSFGFGGTNAHAIIEQYIPEKWGALTETRSAPNFLPFCLSAASEKSLFEQARRLCSWVRNTAGISLPDLAWTLSDRRSVFPFRWYFSASNTEQLGTKIEKQLESSYEATPILSRTPKILGVFTGQGAQWAAMGRSLIRQSGYIENIIDQLETSLATLPDPPVWSLKGEILADADHSRVPEATLSQPLCTAIQIILVDMLKVAGIKFDAVVGHSSGEIGAAYAAGFLSAKDAIRIAYYRGVHSKLARGPNGEKGAMMVVGTSLDDALELCDFDELQGRVTVAANNSSSSVTLTGDEDGIQDAMEVLKDENKFARILRVDTAYHSHHMLHCASPYLESMRRCGIQPLDDAAHACSWFSSVTEHEITRRTEGLDGEYWKDNLVKSVMFRQAIERAVSAKGGFDLALEIGPHPALQGPTLQTIQELCGDRIPYTGLLNRGVDDIEAFSEALGYIWRHSSDSIVNFEAYDGALSGFQPLRMLKGLPTYAFDHDRIYWRESRLSKAIRTRKTPYHELLGVPCPDGTNPTLLRWKNLLDPKEIPWLKGHAVQGQVVFPAAGYISMAVDACRVLASDRTIQSLEILDFVIGKAIVFDERSLGIETMLTLLLDQEPDGDGGTLSGTLRLYASLASSNSDVNPLTLRCSCQILVVFGEPLADILPARGDKFGNVVDVDSDKFYKHLAEVGYEYSGLFRGLSHMKRTLDAGTARISSPARTDPVRSPTAHPAMLDCTIQAVLLGFCFPGDGKLYAMHVPTKIKRISINLPQLENETRAASLLPVDSVVNGTGVVSGDVRLFGADGSTALLQMEGIEVVSLSPAMPDDDAKLFFTSELGVAIPDGDLMSKCQRATEDDYAFAVVCERIAYFYLRNLLAVLTPKDIERSEWHHKRLVCYARKVLGELQSGIDPMTDPKWYNDSREDIMAMMDTHKHRLEIGLARAVGENLPAAVRGETVILEHMMADNHLNNLYQYGMGFLENTNFLAEAVAQIAFRYPHMNILEVGAGTGGATKVIMPKLGKAFSSYTFTDISGGFFPKARDVFNDYNDCMTFKTLDVEKDVVEQGFDEHSYDLVIASLVLHATSDIEHTLRNIRRLLKPGGYIVMMEITNLRPVRLGFAMSGLQGWWLGDEEDGRLWSPAVDANRWNNILQQVGFSCIDAMTPELDPEPWLLSVMVSQAVDDRIRALRKPLTAPVPETAKNSAELIILGGAKLHTSLLASDIEPLVSSRFNNISRAATLEQLLNMDIKPRTTILSLTDLDSPVFKNITDDRLSSLQRLCDHARNVLWLTQDCGAGDPYQSMTVGFGRTVAVEIPQIRLQFLDFAGNTKPRPDFVAETLLRLVISEQWEIAGEMDRMLWSVEQELVLNEDRLFVRRLLPSTDRNDRYNSTRREVIKHVSPAIEQVSVVREQDRFVLTDKWTRSLLKREDHAGTTTVRLSHSLLRPMKLARSGSFYVSLGKIAGSGRPVVALSKSLSSTICIPTEWALPYNAPQDENSAKCYLAAFASAALGRYLVSNAIPGTKIVTYEIPPFLVDSFATQASEKGITLVHATITPSKAFDPSLLYIHPRTLVRDIRNLIPKNVSLFVDFSLPTTIHKIGRMISAELSEVAPTITADALFGTEDLKQQSAVFDELEWLICLASHLRPSLNAPIREIALADVSALVTANETDGTIVSWTANKTVPVKAENIDAHFTFKSDRTYILFGLSGQLGKSLCTWMVQHGARHVVLTSRRPDVDAAWVKTMKSLEADIQFKANDITDRDAVATMINDVRTTMPPIAGIANGAMLLQDTAIRAMDLEVLNRVLRPKVEGSRYLDELLKNDNLDFAIFFSSLAAVFGSHGQRNYTTANMYMNGLVGQRRKKGLPGSVIAIGTITGIGYMARELTEKDLTRIRTSGYSPLSERDFHQLFCEATLASRPDSCMNPEIVCGVNIARPGEKRPDTWHTNPMFSHCIIKRESVKKDNGSDAALPIKANLLAAKSMEAAFNVIKESFQRRLQGMLQSETTVNLHLPAEELGVDSLVAVDIRTWFLKELNVDLPVLKILGGASVADMLEYCLENISPELIPGVDVKSRFKATITNNNDLPPEAEPGSSDNRTVSSDQSKFSNQPTPVDTSTSQISIASSDNVGAVEEKADILARSEVMSFGQSRFWFLQFYLEDKTAFNIVTQITMKGYIHVENLRRAVALVGQHHAALRTRFFVDERGQPVQGILENSKLRLQHLDISKSEDAKAEFIRMKNYVYDLENGETMQMSLLSDSSNGTHYLIVGYHHINMDGISLGVLLGDIHKAYRGIRLAPVLQYPDFSARQRKALESGDMDNEIAFWKKEFEPFPQVLPLLPFSTATTRRPLSHYRAYTDEVTVPLNVADQIREVVRKYRVSSFHVYLATFRVLLMRIMGIDDIVIGMGDANRMEPELQNSIGMFLNLLPLRFRPTGQQQTFETALREARSQVGKALAHSRIPFDALLEELQAPRSADSAPLFQAFIDYRQPMPDRSHLLDCRTIKEDYVRGDTAYEIAIDIIDTHKRDARVQFNVPELLYSSTDVQVLSQTYIRLLSEYTKIPTTDLDHVPLFSSKEVQQAIQLGKGPAKDSEWKTLPLRIQEIISTYGDRVAVRDGHGQSFSYKQLGDKIRAITHQLTLAGVNSGSVVAVLQEPSVYWAVSVLSLLCMGAVYVPLDAQSPHKRLISIIQDSKPVALLAHAATKQLLGLLELDNSTWTIWIEQCLVGSNNIPLIEEKEDPHRPAFILYTSGSTGVPKGVVLKQSNLLNQIENTVKFYDVQPGWTVLQQTAYSFDISMWQLLIAVTSGGSLYVVPQQLRGDPLALCRIIATENITITGTTPSEYGSWLRHGDRDALRNSGWKVVNCGGEPLLPTLQGDFRALGKADLRLFNAYAPCEVTFVSHEIEIDYNKPTSEINTATVVGYSLPNYSVYILDNDLNPLPAGMSGQIAIGGGGVAAGYLRSELTETCFKLNPFATERDVANGWTTMYLTGDRGFLRDDGTLVFTSRLSSQTQVKIRGMRFDLQDVEANLIRTAKGVLAGAVVSLRSSNPQFLVAHVTFTNACDLTDRGTFCQTLIDELPLSPHMKPVVIVPVEEIPLTVNSKVDRIAVQQLPLPDSSRMLQDGSDFSAIEKQLLALWRDLLPVEVLRLKTITIDTDFFSIGGNSLLLVKLQAEMNQHFGVLIPLVQLFETPTLRGMSSRLGGMDAHDVGPINWDNEIELLQLLAPPTSTTASRESMFQPCSVVLTGATGFLGRAILRQLLEQPGVERIDCIAVRNMSHRKLPAIFSSPKVYLHAGDLTLPNLGLSDTATIFDRADVVVHNAADVSFMKSYHSLRPSNVDSTRYLITLTAPRRIPLHYVSSAGVAHLAGGEPLGEVSVADSTPPTDGSDGYVATKWASERLLECAHALTGLPVWIHRPSSIMGDGAPETDLMANLLKYTLTLRAVPLLQTGTREQKSKSKSFLDFVDVDTTARAIVHSITDADRGWTSEVKYTYHSGEYIIPVDALSMEPKVEDVTGGANDVFTEGFKLLPLAEWTEKAKAAGMDELIVEFLKTAVNNAKPLGDLVLFPRLLKGEEIS